MERWEKAIMEYWEGWQKGTWNDGRLERRVLGNKSIEKSQAL
jgi:hypothetical protein